MDKTKLIYKVLSGKAGESEKKKLDGWVAASAANKTEYDDIKLLWDSAKETERPGADVHFYDGLLQIKTLIHQRRRKRRRKKTVVSAVLTIIGFIAFAIFFFQHRGSGNESRAYHKFDHDSLEHIIDTLEKDYGVHIEVENKKILNCTFTGTFYNNPVKEIIQSISDGLNLNYENRSGGAFEIKGTGCVSR